MYQSLSIVVPNKKCINNCKFCVSRMHTNDYTNRMDGNSPFYDLYLADYMKRLEYARDNDVNTLMLTGCSEPQQNRRFLTDFGLMMMLMERPFRNIEMQTTGYGLDKNYLRFLRNHVGINTISLSISSLNERQNAEIINFPNDGRLDITRMCEMIKDYDFNLRLSLNLSKHLTSHVNNPEKLFDTCKKLGANQVTLRKLFSSGDNEQSAWIHENDMDELDFGLIRDYIKRFKAIGKLPFGYIMYDVDGMSVVLDDDCMAQELKEEQKYLILRENCKLYSKWDTDASLVF